MRPIVALAYDFDGTLAPGYMQDHAFIDELNIDSSEFWNEVKRTAREQEGDEIHAYMRLMLKKAKEQNLGLSRESWMERRKKLPLYPGVNDWFLRIKTACEYLHLDARQFIISSGNREMIKGSEIGENFERIYASSFSYDENNNADGISLAVNYTNKTQYLYRINKWTLDEWDDQSINKSQLEIDRPVPFERMIFFGDGATDVPAMRTVTSNGGYSIAIYNENDLRSCQAAKDLKRDGRAGYAAPANFVSGSKLYLQVMAILVEISSRYHAKLAACWPD
jgi:phosphoserine phosphatase